MLTLLSQSPPRAVQAAGWPGRRVPAYCTAAGRALLADHDATRLRALLDGSRSSVAAPARRRPSPRSPPGSATAAARGYAVADEELEPGLSAVAAPVRRFDGRIVAALNVSGPPSASPRRLDAAGVEVGARGAVLSAQLREADPRVAEAAT